ncbi:hypothetical protein EYC80_007661 [Monilinia laxa]|uniref:Uncharacterized protein n=1 Tax=Monilinia laxa TaxID=61186 RepID=A0A5N6JWL5_MONLA|nr:hypothetical protein EYC80_007661 [Monilinia laxa]
MINSGSIPQSEYGAVYDDVIRNFVIMLNQPKSVVYRVGMICVEEGQGEGQGEGGEAEEVEEVEELEEVEEAEEAEEAEEVEEGGSMKSC